jgi:L-cystine uptake protein TcyP (sodium:dicarboxylate symporter family)
MRQNDKQLPRLINSMSTVGPPVGPRSLKGAFVSRLPQSVPSQPDSCISEIFYNANMAPPTYIISRVADPIFALLIGVGAAATRIRREEKEKGKTTQQSMDSLKR